MQGLLGVLGLAIFTLGWLAPGHYPPWTSFHQQWIAALGVGLIAWGAVASKAPWRWPAPALVLLAFACVPLLQKAAGQVVFTADAVLPALYIAGAALSSAAAFNLARQQRLLWVDALMIALLTAALASSALALLQWLRLGYLAVFLADLPRGGRPYANLAQPNHLATLIGIGIAVTIHLFEQRKLSSPVAALLAVWLGFTLLMTQSRTGWLFVLALVIWHAAAHRRALLRLGTVPVLLGAAAFAAGVWLWTPLNSALLIDEPATLSNRLDTGLRQTLWLAMLEAVERSPWIGWGFNQITHGQLAVAFDHDAGQRMLHSAHTIVLDLPLMVGLPIALAMFALAGGWLFVRARQCRDPATWCLLLALAAILCHALTEFPLDYAYFLLTAALLVGTLHATSDGSQGVQTPKITFALPLAAAFALQVWIGIEYLKVEESARQVRMVLAGIGVDKVWRVPEPDVALLDVPREYHRFLNTHARAGMRDEEIDWMRDVVWRNPIPPAMLRYALAAGLNGRTEEAKRTLRAICAIHPPDRCDEARESWHNARAQYSSLSTVSGP
jgi:O-antigen ligase